MKDTSSSDGRLKEERAGTGERPNFFFNHPQNVSYFQCLDRKESWALYWRGIRECDTGAYFILSLMDRYYEKNMSLDKALQLVYKCIDEVRNRLVVAPPNFVIKIVDKDGARVHEWRRTVHDNQGPPASSASPMATEDIWGLEFKTLRKWPKHGLL